MDSDTIVKLKSTTDEERVFEVTLEEGDISELIRNTTRTKDSEETEIEIEIARVKRECLAKVVEFMKHYKEDKMKEIPSPLDRLTFNEVCGRATFTLCFRGFMVLHSPSPGHPFVVHR